MKLTFRPQAERDLRWFAYYYGYRFPEGRRQAETRLRMAIELLQANPFAGPPMEDVSARKLPIHRTPFVLVYTVADDTIDILRVWDARADPEGLSEN